jgi:hypothetical protein
MCKDNIKENEIIDEVDVNIMILNKLTEISEKLHNINKTILLVSPNIKMK